MHYASKPKPFIIFEMKRVAKAFSLFIASTTYVWLLFLAATSIAAFFVFKEPTTVKYWLDESGAYVSIVDEVSKLATIQQKQENSLVQITHEDIQSTAEQTFPPETIQADVEGMIDGFYGWFKGDTTGPEFTIDFSGRQATFASAMTDKLEQKINALPECETGGRFTVQAFDPFKAECRPKGVDLTQELTSFEEEIATSKDILPEVEYTGDDVVVHSESGEPQRVASALPWVPNAYKALLWAPWGIAVLALLAGLTMIFLSTSRRKGLKRFAGGLLFSGVILTLSGLFLRPAFERLNQWSSDSLGAQASLTQNVIDPIFKEVNITFSRYSVIFGIGYIVPALLTYGALVITRHRKEVDQKAVHEEIEQPQIIANTELEQPPALMPGIDQKATLDQESATEFKKPTDPPYSPKAMPQNGRNYDRRPPRVQG